MEKTRKRELDILRSTAIYTGIMLQQVLLDRYIVTGESHSRY